jgi:hypothetical protein
LRAYTSSKTKAKTTICKVTDIIHLEKGQSKEFQLSMPLKMEEKLYKAADKMFKQAGTKDPEKNVGSKFHELLTKGLQPSV